MPLLVRLNAEIRVPPLIGSFPPRGLFPKTSTTHCPQQALRGPDSFHSHNTQVGPLHTLTPVKSFCESCSLKVRHQGQKTM